MRYKSTWGGRCRREIAHCPMPYMALLQPGLPAKKPSSGSAPSCHFFQPQCFSPFMPL